MSYNEQLADRIRIALQDLPKLEEKKMFSGLAFLVDDKMCINVSADRIMCRIDPELHEQLLLERPCRSVIMKGKEFKGFIWVDEEDVARKKDLDFWIELCLDFNPRAKASKTKTSRGKKVAKVKTPVKKKTPAKKR